MCFWNRASGRILCSVRYIWTLIPRSPAWTPSFSDANSGLPILKILQD